MALVRCRTSFTKGTPTGEETVLAGEVFEDTHWLVVGSPADYWEPLEVRNVVEEATATPGKKRATKAPATEK
jgi:hypothetical protein